MWNDQCVVIWLWKKINILEYAFGGGGHKKAYAVYAFINVDNCERPLRTVIGMLIFPTSMRGVLLSLSLVAFYYHTYLQQADYVGKLEPLTSVINPVYKFHW